MGTPAPDLVKRLVDRFDQDRKVFVSTDYKEEQLRAEFLNPFFTALGWDMDNKQGLSETFKQVIHEESIKVAGASKAPDYTFRIGGRRTFFVEAKKPAVNVALDSAPAFQLRRYAWTARLPVSILSDFEEFAVYDCRLRPFKTDKPATARTMLLGYQDYATRWDELSGLFSPDAIQRGALERYVESNKTKRGTTAVDDAFLEEISRWREVLAKNIALRNPRLSTRQLNFAVQRTIDRLIFLRICEDRGIENYAWLQSLLNGERVYARLLKHFRDADDKYNSGLFCFTRKTGTVPDCGRARAAGDCPEFSEGPDLLSLELNIDDKPLKDIIGNLYYPDSPYEFSVMPADVLGQVYEQFLGKVIRLTAGHQAKVEEKPEVRKAGGVYYTPTYIVDYIVRNTVGKLLEGGSGPNPKPLTPEQASRLRILDPACGSGSFLLGAYQYLLDWHLEHYVAHPPSSRAPRPTSPVYQDSKGNWRLTTAERKRILLNNIFGVDIDSQAVEVTKLSLLLKVLEGENQETLGSQLKLYHERALPDLGSNIKCGNSLIGPDFYQGEQQGLFADEEERLRVNVFDWNAAFPDIMKRGGFDAVIGNPPYVRPHNIPTDVKEALWRSLDTFVAKSDMYSCFMEKGLKVTRPSGRFGFIVPVTWTSLESFTKIRQFFVQNAHVEKLVQLPKKVFEDATVETCIFVVRRALPRERLARRPVMIERLGPEGRPSVVRKFEQGEIEQAHLCNFQLMGRAESSGVLARVANAGKPLSEFVDFLYGFKTGDDTMFIHGSRRTKADQLFIRSAAIRRYAHDKPREYVTYDPEAMTRHRATARPGDAHRFESEKLIVSRMGKALVAFYDAGGLYVKDAMLLLPKDYSHSLKYLLGLVNSTLLNYYYREFFVTIDVLKNALLSMPVRAIDFSNKANKARHDKMVGLVETMLKLHKDLPKAKTPHEQESLQRQIAATDKQIDSLVYELYGLTDDEIRIVETP